jgi:hypothetical protein
MEQMTGSDEIRGRGRREMRRIKTEMEKKKKKNN